jgi:hypothetical protein
MTLSIIAGKPGSGKTYHMSTLLVDMLTDWLRYEIKHWDEEKKDYIYGEEYPSSIWTNIVFNEKGLNETISKRVGQEVDAWKYVHFCDDSFFDDMNCTYWWNKFSAKSVIIIDEVHFHLGRKVDFGSLDLETELVNWISTHRHSQQELYFLSQHTDQFANSVLGIADLLLEIVNVKSLVLPWPISVPMSDFEELKRSFGITAQYYQANVGNFRGKAIRWSGASERHLMSTDIFRVYQSHDSGVESSDRPSLKMTPLGGVVWFARRHAWHLVPKLGLIASIPFVGMFVLMSLPGLLASSMTGSKFAAPAGQVEKVEEKSKESGHEKKESGVERTVGKSVIKDSLEGVPVMVHSAAEGAVVPSGVDVAPGVGVPSGVGGMFGVGRESKREVKIVMLYQKGVMLNDGRKVTIGEAFDIDGETETLCVACPVCGVIGFESGKRIKF